MGRDAGGALASAGLFACCLYCCNAAGEARGFQRGVRIASAPRQVLVQPLPQVVYAQPAPIVTVQQPSGAATIVPDFDMYGGVVALPCPRLFLNKNVIERV